MWKRFSIKKTDWTGVILISVNAEKCLNKERLKKFYEEQIYIYFAVFSLTIQRHSSRKTDKEP